MKLCSRHGLFELMSVNLSQARRHNSAKFSIFFNMKVRCVFSLDENTQYTMFN